MTWVHVNRDPGPKEFAAACHPSFQVDERVCELRITEALLEVLDCGGFKKITGSYGTSADFLGGVTVSKSVTAD